MDSSDGEPRRMSTLSSPVEPCSSDTSPQAKENEVMRLSFCICRLVIVLMLLVSSVNAAGISEQLAGKTASQAATIKAQEIVKDTGVVAISKNYTEPITSGGNVLGDLTIRSITYDEKMNAVKVVYEATINGREKAITNPVRIRNPPVRIVTGVERSDPKNESSELIYTTVEDPKQALLETLWQIASTKPDGKATFIPGDPTLVVYAHAGDGYVYNTSSWGAGDTFAVKSRGIGAAWAYDDTSSFVRTGIYADNTADRFYYLFRGYFPFDSSGVGATSGITSAKMAVKGTAWTDFTHALGEPTYGITRAYPLNPTTRARSDYERVDHIALGANVTQNSFESNTISGIYTNFTITNLSVINKTGYTTLALRQSWDIDGVFGGTWASGQTTKAEVKSAETAGTSSDPYLEIVYVEDAVAPDASFTCTPTSGDVVLSVTCTDTSTLTPPTAWNWSFGDGSYSNLQNPTHSYTFTGLFSVNMTATNAWGSDFMLRSNYINVTTHPVINITSKTHFVFNGTNQSVGVDNWSWKFSDDSNTSTFYGQNLEHWLEWGLTHIVTLTAVEGVNSTTIYETINLQGGSDDSGSSSGGASMAQDDTMAYTVGFLSMVGVMIAIGISIAMKNGKRRNGK